MKDSTSNHPPELLHSASRPSGVSRELDAAVVRVRSAAGDVAGSGFLIEARHIVTCAHVVNAALARAISDRSKPEDVLDVDFPLIAPDQTVPVRVEAWYPIQQDDSGDIAVLSLTQDPPKGLIPARLLSAGDFWGHPFRTFGFPRRHDHGVWVSGVLRGSQSVGWVQMEGTASGYAVEGGFSGGAVWDDNLAGVVGMTVAADSHSGVRTAFLITAEQLIRAWPPLSERTLPPCPYRGLHPFRTQDAGTFYGREDVTERLIREVTHRSIVALVGPSGSGKSSVLFAGLLPHAEQRGWVTASMRPAQARTPILSLSGALLDILEPDLAEVDRIKALHSLAELISEGHCAEVIDRVITRSQPARLLLAIDQFEELFARDRTVINEFTRIIISAAQAHQGPLGPNVTVALTLRADFLNSALQDPVMAAVLEDSVITIGELGRSQLRAVIEGPLPQGVKYESGLVDRILADVGEEPGSLPLLEFALTLLWERQERGVLTHAAYQELGGVDGSLAAYAERIYSDQLLPGDQDNARRLFIQLARPSDVGTPVRRVARPLELGETRWHLAQRLAATRLLVTDRDPTGTESVELVHEALITGWTRLNNWIEEDRAFRAWQEQLRNALAAWEALGQDSGALLRGAPLAEAERWLSERPDDLAEPEVNFIRNSVAWRGRSLRRLRTAVISLTMLLLAAIGLGVVVILQVNESSKQRLIGGSRDLASQAQGLAATDPRTAILLAVSAYKMHSGPEATRALTKLVDQHSQIDTILTPDLPAIQTIKFSPADPDLLALIGSNYVALWDIGSNSARFVRTFDGQLKSTAFSADGRTMVLERSGASGRTSLSLWSISENDLVDLDGAEFTTSNEIAGMRLSPDGNILAVCVKDTIALWDLQRKSPLPRTGRVDSATYGCGAGFTSAQKLVYIQQSAVVTWDPRTGKAINKDSLPPVSRDESPCPGSSPYILVAPNGRIGAISDSSGNFSWWDLDRGRALRPVSSISEGQCIDLDGIAFSADSRVALINRYNSAFVTFDLAKLRPIAGYSVPELGGYLTPSINADRTMAAWSLSRSTNSLALVRLGQHPRLPVSDYLSDSAQTSALLRDEPHRMATVTQDGVAFYSYERPQHFFEESRRVQMSIDGTQIVAISPTGHHVAIVQTSSAPRRVTLYTIAPGDAVTLLAFEGHRSSVTALAFDEEGQYVASVDATEIVLQSVKDKSYARTIPLGGSDSVGALAVSAGGRYVGAIDGGRARVWEMTSATPTELVDRGAGSLCFSGSGRWLAVVTESETQLWDMSRKTLFNRLPGGYGGCSFSSDERYVAVPEGGATGSSGLDVLRLPDFAHVGSITSSSRVVFLPAPGRVLAIGGVVRVASFDPDSAIRTACAITANGSLSEREWRQYAPGLKYIAACP